MPESTREDTDDRPGGGPGPETSPGPMLEALAVRQKARTGVVVGVAVGVLAYLVFVVVRGQPVRLAALYVVSVLVVASATAALVTVVLVTRTILRATVDGRRWIRRAGTASATAGAVLAVLTTVGPALGVVAGDAALVAYDLLLPVCAAGVLAGAWALHAAHRPRDGYGRLGLAGWAVTAPAALLTCWIVAVEAPTFLGRPLETVSPVGLLTVSLALAGGTSLLGAAALRAGAVPARGPLLALFALPLALGGLTVALAVDAGGLAGAYLDPPAPSTVALGLPVALAWTVIGVDLRAGRGVPPADVLGIDLVPGASERREQATDGAAPGTDDGTPDSDRSSGPTDV